MSEAEYMAQKILEKYASRNLTKPVIVMDNEAMFTVMNFLKTIPLINKFKGHIKKVYLITSDYHINRSNAILDQFVENKLTQVPFESSYAPHPNTGESGCDEWLYQKVGGSTRITGILDKSRDSSNAHCFAAMCRVIKTNPRFNAKMILEAKLDPGKYDANMVRLHKLEHEKAIADVDAFIRQYQENNIPELQALSCLREKQIMLELNGDDAGARGVAEEIAEIWQIEKIQASLRAKETQLIQFALDFMAPFEGFCIADQ